MANDGLNCLKNLMQVMSCDGEMNQKEKDFLSSAAKSLNIEVEDWNALLKDVARDGQEIYPIAHRKRAEATLKAMALMAKSDKEVNEQEKTLLYAYAKSIGITKEQWKQMILELDAEHVFEPFQQSVGQLAVLKDDFEKIDAFLKTAQENGTLTRTLTIMDYLKEPNLFDGEKVCFHASENKERTLKICSALLQKAGHQTICILTRFQGLQVKYLHEAGLEKCIIEPVYAKDILDLF